MKRIVLQESEKTEILNQHNRFKNILKETLDKKNKGLGIDDSLLEQTQGPIEPPTGDALIRKAQQVCNTLKSGRLFKLTNGGALALNVKASVDGPVDSTTNKPKYVAGDVLIYQNNMTYDVYDGVKVADQDWQKKGTYRWKCSAINQEYDAQTAAAKEAEAKKKAEEQASLTAEQKSFIKMLTDQGYIVGPPPSQIASNRLKPVQLGTIPKLEKYFPNGLDVYYDPTKRSTSNVNAYKERASKMVASVDTCKDIIQTYWDDYSGGGEGDLTDTLFLDTRDQAQACASKYYPKWDGLQGGVLGVGSGQNHLNNIIDVLTGRKTEYKGTVIPSRASGWMLKPPPKRR